MSKRRRRTPAQMLQAKEPEVAVTAVTNISNLDEATELVEREYKKDLMLDYIVLENGNVFYGNNRNPALKYAARFDLKYFEVKLK